MLVWLLLLYSSLLFLCLAPVAVLAVPRNITVDDTDSAIQYISSPSSAGSWAAGPSQPCPGCRGSSPDPKYAYGGSWHGALWTPAWKGQGETPPAFTFTFTGTAVYVFNILLPDRTNAYTSTTVLTFSMDGEAVGSNFEHNPHSTDEGFSEIAYNALVFSQDGLSNGQHRLEVTAVEDDSSIILLDYIIYTVDEPATSAPSPTSLPSNPQPSISSAGASRSSPSTTLPTSLTDLNSRSTYASSLSAIHLPSTTLSVTGPSRVVESTTVTSVINGSTVVQTAVQTLTTVALLSTQTSISRDPSYIPPDSTLSGIASLQAASGHGKAAIPIAAIAGGTVGALVILGLFVTLLFVHRSRTKHRLTFVEVSEDEKGARSEGRDSSHSGAFLLDGHRASEAGSPVLQEPLGLCVPSPTGLAPARPRRSSDFPFGTSSDPPSPFRISLTPAWLLSAADPSDASSLHHTSDALTFIGTPPTEPRPESGSVPTEDRTSGRLARLREQVLRTLSPRSSIPSSLS